MREDTTLSSAHVARVSKLVADAIARIGDPAVTPPVGDDYRVGVHYYENEWQTLTVDVDMGGFGLPLCASAFETHTDGEPDLARLADAVAARVADASRGRPVIARRLAAAHQAAEETATRIGARVLAVRIARNQTDARMSARDHWLEVELEVLDDALRPSVVKLLGTGPRMLRGAIAPYERKQRLRSRRLASLSTGEVIHVDAVAEAAIATTGRSVGSVAADLLDAARCGRWTQLSGIQWTDHVSVRLLDGVIVCSAMLPGVGYIDIDELRLDQVLPETLQTSLRSRRLDAIADHPVLRCDSRLVSSQGEEGGPTRLKFRSSSRPVTAGEIEGRQLPLAA
ncbi:hypothetical protein GGQ80_002967 [Sphingomonas jinjuensis]|uniref:Uncharacterized protein n=1 Tax=Sphingomonas jinjuensis TaxID=535907 RepID=A0A840FAJ4_9SPHN|nr:hypothetical protein [Sphingomonas jinjuensis]MBB4155050.1 hypothetical protein [Sphingomonas jinjuensis]